MYAKVVSIVCYNFVLVYECINIVNACMWLVMPDNKLLAT